MAKKIVIKQRKKFESVIKKSFCKFWGKGEQLQFRINDMIAAAGFLRSLWDSAKIAEFQQIGTVSNHALLKLPEMYGGGKPNIVFGDDEKRCGTPHGIFPHFHGNFKTVDFFTCLQVFFNGLILFLILFGKNNFYFRIFLEDFVYIFWRSTIVQNLNA